MLFNSYPFLLFFLPAALGGFFLSARFDRRIAAAWLATASLFFYGWWNPASVVLLSASIAFNYLIGLAISRAPSGGIRRALLTAGVGTDLLVLAYYKYADFIVGQLFHLPGGSWTSGIILPLGISFFTFTQIAFLVDASRGIVAEYNPVHYALFVTYFPHLIAGPVLHHKEMMPQFSRPEIYRPRAENFSVGLTIFFLGLFKKIALADGCAILVGTVFDGPTAATRTFFAAWAGALAYTFQIYFDFSGYSDMAVGLSKLFGVVLPLNFDSPYKAESIIEFWRRWHMTLSRFLRDYLYIPLGGGRRGTFRRYLNLMATMLLGGLWHGANWTFLVWGGAHGCLLAANHAWRAWRGDSTGPWPAAERAAGRLATFLAVTTAWVLFRAKDFEKALTVFRGMAGVNGAVLPATWAARLPSWAMRLKPAALRFGDAGGFGGATILHMGTLLVIVWCLPNVAELMAGRNPTLDAPASSRPSRLLWRPDAFWLLTAAALGLAGFVMIGAGASEFLYYRF